MVFQFARHTTNTPKIIICKQRALGAGEKVQFHLKFKQSISPDKCESFIWTYISQGEAQNKLYDEAVTLVETESRVRSPSRLANSAHFSNMLATAPNYGYGNYPKAKPHLVARRFVPKCHHFGSQITPWLGLVYSRPPCY